MLVTLYAVQCYCVVKYLLISTMLFLVMVQLQLIKHTATSTVSAPHSDKGFTITALLLYKHPSIPSILGEALISSKG